MASRRDLSDGAKLLHATLVSQHRLGRAWTQTELGERIGGSRQKVWRLTGELVAAGLLLVIRIGLGRPNQYVLVGIDQDDLDGSGGRASGGPASGPLTRTRSFYPKERDRKTGYIQPNRAAGYIRPPSSGSLLETRYGRYVRPGG